MATEASANQARSRTKRWRRGIVARLELGFMGCKVPPEISAKKRGNRWDGRKLVVKIAEKVQRSNGGGVEIRCD